MATEASGMSATSFISAPWTLALFTRAFTASALSKTNCSRDCKSRSEEDAVSLFRRRALWDHLLLSRFLVGAQCRWQSQSQAGFIGWGCVDIHRWCRDELFIVRCMLVKQTPKWIHRRVDSTAYISCSEYDRTLDSGVTKSLKARVTVKCICKEC